VVQDLARGNGGQAVLPGERLRLELIFSGE
jgi:hypothetical protein